MTFAGQQTAPSIGLTFADDPDSTVWLAQRRTSGHAWTQASWPLAGYTGRTIAAISVGFQSTVAVEDYTVRIGEPRVERAHEKLQPRAPRNFTVEQLFVAANAATAFFSWEFNGPDIWYYDLSQIRNGGRQWIGRTYDENYVVPGLTRQSNGSTLVFEIVAVAQDGSRSQPTQAVTHWE